MRQEQAPAAPSTDYMAQAQSLAYQQDVDALRALYATAKANGASTKTLMNIEALAGEIKDPAGKDEKPTGLV
jgi:hypothetical protein